MTPPVSDEEMQRTIAAYAAHGGNQVRMANELGIARSTLQSRLKRLARTGMLGHKPVLPGFEISRITSTPSGDFIQQKPEQDRAGFNVPDGHIIKGVSAYLDGNGGVVGQWIKTREGIAHTTAIEAIKDAFADYQGAAAISQPPAAVDTDLLTLLPCNDWHVGVYVWGEEAGENWNLDKAERIIGQGVEEAVWRSPASAEAIVLGGGDLMHSDNNENRTSRSGNALDVDGRHQKVLGVTCRLMVRTIDVALLRHGRVTVRILPGNHDEYSSVAIAYFLLAWYRNEPRVTVDVDPSLFFWFRWGSVLLGSTHGHTVKAAQMPSIMAHRRAEDWGVTRFRYVHTFHLHHSAKTATEGNGVICEIHQAPIPQDAWHFGSGFLSGRSLQTITYHKNFGEISRSRVAILDAAA